MARVGVLALQGGYAAHATALRELGHTVTLVREATDLDALDGLVLPGGESSTHLKLLRRHGLWAALDTFVRSGKPVLATCAGLILAARAVRQPAQQSFGWLDVEVARNAWGRQLESFEAIADEGPLGRIPLMFIRAPRLIELGADVEILATFEGEPIAIQQANVVGVAFHPELTDDRTVHARVFGRGA